MTLQPKIPLRFFEKLTPKAQIVIRTVSPIFGTSPYFFPEYTIHSRTHVEHVWEYADKLIPNDTFAKLTAIDISVLVLGVYIHDLGMFIKPDGLEALRKIEPFRKHWAEHQRWLHRASGMELDTIFADKPHEFSEDNVCVCADFLRRYHPDAAQYIAKHGLPGAIENDVLAGLDENTRILIGALAKSHGYAMREPNIPMLGYRQNKPLNVPIYYLMALLRIADLLDADNNRAPKIVADMQHFSSSISASEWELNRLISDRQWETEPETLHIIATPKTSSQYVKLKSWLEYWQSDLDISWAVLGEKHGNGYYLAVRRITSSLDEINEFDFLPENASLRVNPEISKLLVGPLYGNDPRYGVRELLSNALDACREREALDPSYAGKAEIMLTLDTNAKTFTCIDNGIGMNADVIVNYFMKVGASFRTSEAWKLNFAPYGQSKILRSGRFGIGILAAYLLGDEIVVSTRHLKEKRGYRFTVRLDSAVPDIESCDCEVGTKIVIRKLADEKNSINFESNYIKNCVFLGPPNEFKFYCAVETESDYGDNIPWYFNNYPVVHYLRDGCQISDSIRDLSCEKPYEDFTSDSIQYSLYKIQESDIGHGSYPFVYHNGIYVSQMKKDLKNSDGSYVENRYLYFININDKNNELVLNLKKDAFDSSAIKHFFYPC